MPRQPSAPPNAPPRRGRPLDTGLRQRLLDHTIRVLLETGYAKFSMIAVAQSAKASKETLYRQFGDKDGLLRAALTSSAGWIAPLLLDGLTDDLAPHARLRRLGLNYLGACYRPGSLALLRIAIAGGPDGLGALFESEITEKALVVVEGELTRLGSVHPRADAETFLGAILGKDYERRLLGVEPREEGAMERQLDHALRLLGPYVDSLAPKKRKGPG